MVWSVWPSARADMKSNGEPRDSGVAEELSSQSGVHSDVVVVSTDWERNGWRAWGKGLPKAVYEVFDGLAWADGGAGCGIVSSGPRAFLSCGAPAAKICRGEEYVLPCDGTTIPKGGAYGAGADCRRNMGNVSANLALISSSLRRNSSSLVSECPMTAGMPTASPEPRALLSFILLDISSSSDSYCSPFSTICGVIFSLLPVRRKWTSEALWADSSRASALRSLRREAAMKARSRSSDGVRPPCKCMGQHCTVVVGGATLTLRSVLDLPTRPVETRPRS